MREQDYIYIYMPYYLTIASAKCSYRSSNLLIDVQFVLSSPTKTHHKSNFASRLSTLTILFRQQLSNFLMLYAIDFSDFLFHPKEREIRSLNIRNGELSSEIQMTSTTSNQQISHAVQIIKYVDRRRSFDFILSALLVWTLI